ncbi:hypothetical protein B0H16DRAFT_1447048 [Mycena metata]|uniref:N-acetyltransferase domain-containing protein n=1 Tax=Mycena metata TaxID=1033252 RepID=A0AAD7P0L4_9AGAR|nr:hypothetical protein B0H16DRAFT_1447048 [Mycena metata]
MKLSAIAGPEISTAQLQACAKLFSCNYGVWSSQATQIAPSLKPGLSPYLTRRAARITRFISRLLICEIDDQLVGHLFATTWSYEQASGHESTVCWVTQLVVRSEFRRRGIASILMRLLRTEEGDATAFGIVSSHPAGCVVLCKQLGPYTEFFVDHDEPLRVVKTIEEKIKAKWPPGELLDGHEFFVLVSAIAEVGPGARSAARFDHDSLLASMISR